MCIAIYKVHHASSIYFKYMYVSALNTAQCNCICLDTSRQWTPKVYKKGHCITLNKAVKTNQNQILHCLSIKAKTHVEKNVAKIASTCLLID